MTLDSRLRALPFLETAGCDAKFQEQCMMLDAIMVSVLPPETGR
jgi:hypothetical protein